MSVKRGSKRHVPSVMARLMGFEEIQPPQPVHKKPRVFSEDYLHRIASIGAREKCSDSIWLRVEETDECKTILQVLQRLRRNKHHSLPFQMRQIHFKANTVLMEAKHVLGDKKVQNDASTVNNSEAHNQEYIRKMNLNFTNKSSEPSHLHTSLESVLQSSCAYEFRDGKFRRNSERWNVESSKRLCVPTTDAVLLKPKHGEADGAAGHLEEKKTLRSGLRPVRRSRFLRETSRKTEHVISSLPVNEPMSENSGNGFIANDSGSSSPSSPVLSCKKNQLSSSDGSYATMEAKKKISEIWKTARRFQQAELVNMSHPDKHSMYGLSKQIIPENANVKLGVPSGINSVRESIKSRSLLPFFKAVASPNTRTSRASLENGQNKLAEQDFYQESESHNNKGREEDMFDQDFVVPKLSTRSAFSISMKLDDENEVVKMFPSNHERQLEVQNWISSGHQNDSSSHIDVSSIQQEMPNEFFEEDSVASQFSGTPESPISFEECYQQSPNSVLESLYKKEMPSTTACFKSADTYLSGLHVQLELLKSETVDSYSEGSSIIVSSDDDAGEGSVSDTEENEDPFRSFKVEESRDFSYLVDILTESGFKNKSLHFQEYPISYSIFETLEKKYGEQVSWKRSERRLLFDRINSGLMELFQTSIGLLTGTKPVARRFSYSYEQEAIDDKLWMLLLAQEKEASKESEKFLGKDDGWMELGEDIQDISREIENSLIEELVADVCMEMFN